MKPQKTLAFIHPTGKEVFRIVLANKNGFRVTITNLGNIISALEFNGVNLVLGFDDLHHYISPVYLASYPYLGAVIGRTANRIKDGRFELDGKSYQLAQNLGNDNLHGGIEGFDKKVWEVVSINEEENSVRFRYESTDGEEHFPGHLIVEQEYKLTASNELIMDSFAQTDAPTLINLTHHDYFNLNGHGPIGKHRIRINAGKYLGQDGQLVADGRRISVAGTVYDFQTTKEVLSESAGYDQSFCIEDADGNLTWAAEATGDISGITLQVWTNDPIVHLYTGSGLPELEMAGKKYFGPSTGFCFETQKEPNAINVPGFSNTVLRPGERYFQRVVYGVRGEK